MKIKLPKKAPLSLIKRVDKAKKQIQTGTALLRRSHRFGYMTMALGHCERAVLLNDVLHVFNKHSDYEKFINIAR
ncbi:hypothetical protein DDN26_18430 [Vibrio cholerae]|jgi:hypothetical protein|nr:hypothetical protein [Vibrio cholerae]